MPLGWLAGEASAFELKTNITAENIIKAFEKYTRANLNGKRSEKSGAARARVRAGAGASVCACTFGGARAKASQTGKSGKGENKTSKESNKYRSGRFNRRSVTCTFERMRVESEQQKNKKGNRVEPRPVQFAANELLQRNDVNKCFEEANASTEVIMSLLVCSGSSWQRLKTAREL